MCGRQRELGITKVDILAGMHMDKPPPPPKLHVTKALLSFHSKLKIVLLQAQMRAKKGGSNS